MSGDFSSNNGVYTGDLGINLIVELIPGEGTGLFNSMASLCRWMTVIVNHHKLTARR
jgi:hypothetical protein